MTYWKAKLLEEMNCEDLVVLAGEASSAVSDAASSRDAEDGGCCRGHPTV